RHLRFERQLGGLRDRLADTAAHAASDECEVHCRHNDWMAVDRGRSKQRSLAPSGLALRLGEARRVRLRIRKGEHVKRLDLRAQLDQALSVEELAQSLANR